MIDLFQDTISTERNRLHRNKNTWKLSKETFYKTFKLQFPSSQVIQAIWQHKPLCYPEPPRVWVQGWAATHAPSLQVFYLVSRVFSVWTRRDKHEDVVELSSEAREVMRKRLENEYKLYNFVIERLNRQYQECSNKKI